MRMLPVAAVALSMPFAVAAHTIDLAVGDEAVRVAYEGDVAPAAGGMLRADVGALHNEDDGDLIHLGLKVRGDAGGYTVGVEGALGATLYWAGIDHPDEDASAVALTGELHVTPQDWDRVRLAFTLNYAPEVLTFGEGESLLDTAARLEYEVLQETRLYLGYRLARVELEQGGDQDLHQGAQLGINITF
ncbi:MAG: YfaZ family outer membrane protein [Pseudomonadota bacterium]|nr:YfaZ family outer membrane protein [Pseudomonadota bacterium]